MASARSRNLLAQLCILLAAHGQPHAILYSARDLTDYGCKILPRPSLGWPIRCRRVHAKKSYRPFTGRRQPFVTRVSKPPLLACLNLFLGDEKVGSNGVGICSKNTCQVQII